MTLNRSTNKPCIVAVPSADSGTDILGRFDYAYPFGTKGLNINAIARYLGLDGSDEQITSSLRAIIRGIIALFAEKEAYLLETHLTVS